MTRLLCGSTTCPELYSGWVRTATLPIINQKTPPVLTRFPMWEHTGSNRGPSACKADALNQLSYAPLNFSIGIPLEKVQI